MEMNRTSTIYFILKTNTSEAQVDYFAAFWNNLLFECLRNLSAVDCHFSLYTRQTTRFLVNHKENQTDDKFVNNLSNPTSLKMYNTFLCAQVFRQIKTRMRFWVRSLLQYSIDFCIYLQRCKILAQIFISIHLYTLQFKYTLTSIVYECLLHSLPYARIMLSWSV